MKTLFLSSEVYPLAKTGGLADVSESLPVALSSLGVDIRLMLPAYPKALEQLRQRRVDAALGSVMGVDSVRLIAGHMPDTGLPIWLVDAPSLYERAGGLYQDEEGRDWPDNADRFALLSHVAALVARGNAGLDWVPDVVHANDWHTGLLPLLLASTPGARPASLLTIHNMAFQGLFSNDEANRLHLPDAADPASLEYYGGISFLKAGISHADKLTTVSPTYAEQILLPEYGCGLQDVLRERQDDLTGILNGADYDVWDPSMDQELPAKFRPGNFAGKRSCKKRLQKELGFAVAPNVPLVSFVSRLTNQKMADVVLDSLPQLLELNLQFVLHGEGDRALERAFQEAATAHPENIAVRIGYDEGTAHRVLGGADIVLAPSRFEPCGLIQIYGLRYGTVPIVRRTGGLADTVVNADELTMKARTATGFIFEEPSANDMIECVDRALTVYSQPLLWRRIRMQAMKQEFGWEVSAEQYLSLYERLAREETPTVAAENAGLPNGKFLVSTAGRDLIEPDSLEAAGAIDARSGA